MGRCLLSFGEEDLRWPTDKVSTLIYKPRLTLPHLIPDAAQGIVGEELDDIAGREELVTNGEISTVAGCLRLGPHLSALFIAVEVLVHPANSFILLPDVGKLWRIEDGKEIEKCLASRPKKACRVTTIKENTHLTANLVEQALDVKPVAVVRELHQSRCKPDELFEPRGLLPTRNALLYEAAPFEHLERHKPVQHSKGCLTPVFDHRFSLGESTSTPMLHGCDELVAHHTLLIIQIRSRLYGNRAVQPDVEDPLKLSGVLTLQ